MQTENEIRERLDKLLEHTRQLDPKTQMNEIQTNSRIMRELEDTIYSDQYKPRIRVSPSKTVPSANNNATSEQQQQNTIIITKKEEISLPNVSV